MTWHVAIGCHQCPATFRGWTTAFPLSQIAILPGCAACMTAGRPRRAAPEVTAAAGDLRNCARRLLKRAVREVHASPGYSRKELRCSCAETAPAPRTPLAIGCPQISGRVGAMLQAAAPDSRNSDVVARVLTGDLRSSRRACGLQPRISCHVSMHAFQPQSRGDADLRRDL